MFAIIHNTPPFPDASTNPPTFPVHTYHLGLWFNSPQDAKKAVNNDTITPFNGEHHAGGEDTDAERRDKDGAAKRSARMAKVAGPSESATSNVQPW